MDAVFWGNSSSKFVFLFFYIKIISFLHVLISIWILRQKNWKKVLVIIFILFLFIKRHAFLGPYFTIYVFLFTKIWENSLVIIFIIRNPSAIIYPVQILFLLVNNFMNFSLKILFSSPYKKNRSKNSSGFFFHENMALNNAMKCPTYYDRHLSFSWIRNEVQLVVVVAIVTCSCALHFLSHIFPHFEGHDDAMMDNNSITFLLNQV